MRRRHRRAAFEEGAHCSTAARTIRTATSSRGTPWSRERCPVCGSYVVAKTRRGGAVQLQCAADRGHDVTHRSAHERGPAAAEREPSRGMTRSADRHRRRARGLRGGMAGGALRRRGRSLRDAARAQRARAPHRHAGRARVQQLAARRVAGKRRRLAQRGARAARLADRERRRARAPFRRAARWRSTASASASWSNRASLAEPRIRLHREELRAIPLDRPAIVACGPLPSDEFLAAAGCSAAAPAARTRRLHYYDAASPIVAADSIDESQMYRKSRYDKGDGDDYLNIPLDRDAIRAAAADLRTLERHPGKGVRVRRAYFEGCLPIEEMADRGDDVLRFGPLKPVGLRDPRTGRAPYAVVQLRKENADGTAYNLVGFQTRLTWPAQRDAFGKLPGLAARGVAAARRHAPQHVHRLAAPARRALEAARQRRALFCRTDHRRGRLRRSGGVRRDDRTSTPRARSWACRRSTFRARARSAPSSRTCRTATRRTFSRRT